MLSLLLLLLTSISSFTWILFIVSWLIWIVLKLFRRTHPSLLTMLIFSASVLITYFRDWYRLRFYCPELCLTDVTFPYIAEIVFWFVVFYALKIMVLKRA
jgi:hypothetical protein